MSIAKMMLCSFGVSIVRYASIIWGNCCLLYSKGNYTFNVSKSLYDQRCVLKDGD